MHARAMCAGALCLIAARGVSLRCARVVNAGYTHPPQCERGLRVPSSDCLGLMARRDGGALVGGVLDAHVEFGSIEPLREEVGRHVGIVDLVDVDLAGRNALLEHKVAAQEVTRARGGGGVGSDERVRLVVREDGGGVARERAHGT
jgi:hypothetical protein